MVRFQIKPKEFEKFLKVVSCKGTLQFKTKGKVDAFLFSSFFIDVDKENQMLSVLTIDNYFAAVKQLATIKTKVLEEGIVEITDNAFFKVVFDALDKETPLEITSDGSEIIVKNQKGHKYTRRIIGDEGLDNVFNKKDELHNWKNGHTLEKINDKEIWKFTTSQGTTTYPMRIKTTKDELKTFVNDTIKLTKDNSTIIRSENGKITISTGQPNSLTTSEHPLEFENIGLELSDFAVKFSALQTIIPNILDEVIINFRRTTMDTIVMRIESKDKTTSQILSVASQDKDGVLYDEEELEIDDLDEENS